MEKPIPFSPLTNTAQRGIARGATLLGPVNTTYYAPLFKAVRIGNLDATQKFIKEHPEAVKANITSEGETALHIATMFGHLHIVEELVKLMSVEDLELMDYNGITALHCAVFNTTRKAFKAAKCMVEKNKRLVAIPDNNGWIPITMALEFGHTEMARYLYPITPQDALLYGNGELGPLFLCQCYNSMMFDIALELIKSCPKLVVMEGPEESNFSEQKEKEEVSNFSEQKKKKEVSNFWHTLAAVPSALRSEIQPPYSKRSLDTWFRVHQEPTLAVKDFVWNVPETTDQRTEDSVRSTSHAGLSHGARQLVRNALYLLGIKNIYNARLAYKEYLELLHAACTVISTLNEDEMNRSKIAEAVLVAAQRGNPDFIMEAVKVKLSFLWTKDDEEKSLFHLAIQFRQENVFSLIHGLALKHVVANFRDKHGNSLLHMAGLLAPSTKLNRISGALLQMQRELQWFKEVERIMPPMKKESLNNDNFTARELFTKHHEDLVKKGEEWTKGTANSCSVVAALVATITFAAVFTVPGGNDQNKGYPIFLKKKLFLVFSISNAVSLFSSSTSLLMFLGLLTSRYAEDDFHMSLPTKLIIGLSTMFFSIATMMIAFCAGLFLMLRNQYSWIVIPVTVLAGVPVTLYIFLQFPLLVEIYNSTFGRGIFHRNVKSWP